MSTENAPIIETDRLRLRPYQVSDFEAYAALMMSARSQYVDGPISRAQAWDQFASGSGRWALIGYGAWAIERSADAICVGAVALNHPIVDGTERELGWLLWDGFEGNGYALEAAKAGKAYAFNTLRWRTLVSYISRENTKSIRLAERLGGRFDEAASLLTDEETLVYRYI